MLSHERGRVVFPSLPEKPVENIAILVAMRAEADPLIQSLQLKKVNVGLPPQLRLQAYQGEVLHKKIHLIVNGIDPDYSVDQVGTEAAAVSACNIITRLRPDTLISAGTAGGFAERGAAIGDVVVSRGGFFFHDHHIPVDDQFENYARGSYPCLEVPELIKYLRLKSGVISTGNSMRISLEEKRCIEQYGAIAKEMEVAAIAKVARQFNTRVMAVKAITNIVGFEADAASEFKKNFAIATNNLARILPSIIRYLLGKTSQQLQSLAKVEECVA